MNIGILIMAVFFGASLIINIIRLILPIVKDDAPLIYKTNKYLNSKTRAILYISILLSLGFLIVDVILSIGIREMNNIEKFTYILLMGLIIGNCLVYIMLIMQKVFMFNDGIVVNGIFIEWGNIVSLNREDNKLILVFDEKKANNIIPVVTTNNLIIPYEKVTLSILRGKIQEKDTKYIY